MRILHLTLKKKWFDMIASGIKKEEYREEKQYWVDRLTTEIGEEFYTFKDFDFICFRNGYSKDAPTVTVKCNGILYKTGLEEWGAEKGNRYFTIKLGAIISDNPDLNQPRPQLKLGL
ncbi:hypothetical protein [Sphingobacterium faecium]